MITRTFIHLPRVGRVTERRIWAEGVKNWDEFLATERLKAVGAQLKKVYNLILSEHKTRLEEGDARYFANVLKRREHWRLFDVFGKDAAYLDIETTGYAPSHAQTTVVGVYRDRALTQLVSGRDLSGERLDELLAGAKILVTFNGSGFDVPFLREEFGWLDLDIPHFDLFHAGRMVGLSGGLKKVERAVGITRDKGIEGLDGWAAVQLWERYEAGDRPALTTLLAYNQADVFNLVELAYHIYKRLVEKELFY